jgi:hypothetical protein
LRQLAHFFVLFAPFALFGRPFAQTCASERCCCATFQSQHLRTRRLFGHQFHLFLEREERRRKKEEEKKKKRRKEKKEKKRKEKEEEGTVQILVHKHQRTNIIKMKP